MSEEYLRGVARDITHKYFGNNLAIGKTVLHHDGKRKVKITGGQFMGTYGLSNHWYYKEVMPDGSLGPEESDYGWTAEEVFDEG